MADTLLHVKNLHTRFYTEDGVVRAVNGVSFDIQPGEILGLVGESGCGKSVSALSVLRLIPDPPGKIEGGGDRLRGRGHHEDGRGRGATPSGQQDRDDLPGADDVA